jgi:hypothetical protein
VGRLNAGFGPTGLGSILAQNLGRATLDRTAEGGCPHINLPTSTLPTKTFANANDSFLVPPDSLKITLLITIEVCP